MNRSKPPPGAAGEDDPPVTPDPVQVASEESFPASDAPGWSALRFGRTDGHADRDEAEDASSNDRDPVAPADDSNDPAPEPACPGTSR